MTKTLSEQYVKKVKTLLPRHGKAEKEYLKKLQNNLEEFCDENPTISSLSKLEEEFGDTKEAVKEYYNTVSTEDLVKQLNVSKFFKIMLCFILFIILSVSIWITIKTVNEYNVLMNQAIFFEEIIIE